jgi:hypothetical protein
MLNARSDLYHVVDVVHEPNDIPVVHCIDYVLECMSRLHAGETACMN